LEKWHTFFGKCYFYTMGIDERFLFNAGDKGHKIASRFNAMHKEILELKGHRTLSVERSVIGNYFTHFHNPDKNETALTELDKFLSMLREINIVYSVDQDYYYFQKIETAVPVLNPIRFLKVGEAEVYNQIVNLLLTSGFVYYGGTFERKETGCQFNSLTLLKYKSVVDFQLEFPHYSGEE